MLSENVRIFSIKRQNNNFNFVNHKIVELNKFKYITFLRISSFTRIILWSSSDEIFVLEIYKLFAILQE